MLDAGVLQHTAGGVRAISGQESRDILVEFMDKSGLHDLRLLCGGGGPDGLIGSIGVVVIGDGVRGIGAIGVGSGTIAIGTTVNRRVGSGRGGRSEIHWIGG